MSEAEIKAIIDRQKPLPIDIQIWMKSKSHVMWNKVRV